MFEEVEIHPIQLANTINLTYKSHQEAWDLGVCGIEGRIGLFLSCSFRNSQGNICEVCTKKVHKGNLLWGEA